MWKILLLLWCISQFINYLNNLNKSIYAKYIPMNKDNFVYNNEMTNLQDEF